MTLELEPWPLNLDPGPRTLVLEPELVTHSPFFTLTQGLGQRLREGVAMTCLGLCWVEGGSPLGWSVCSCDLVCQGGAMWLVGIAGADTGAPPALLKVNAGVQGAGLLQAISGPPNRHSTFLTANNFTWAVMCPAQGTTLD